MSQKGRGKRLNECQRLEIIEKLSKPNPPSRRAIARTYEVSDTAIRKIWNNRGDIVARSSRMSSSGKDNCYRASQAKFPELEEILYEWIDMMRRAKLAVPPSLAIAKARKIALDMEISNDDFKASWAWLSNFRKRRGLGEMLLHGEGAEVDKNNPELLSALEELYEIIRQYDVENVYNMDETGLFYRVLPRYTLLMPSEDLSSARGEKKAKDRVSLVVCANSTGTHKIPSTMIGKPKKPACIVNKAWPIPYYAQKKAWMDVEVCWKWFNEVFFPAVRVRTSRPVVLILDNAPGHFEAFE